MTRADFDLAGGRSSSSYKRETPTYPENDKKLTNMYIGELKKFSKELNSQNSKKLLAKLQKTKNIRNRIVKAKQAGKFIPNN